MKSLKTDNLSFPSSERGRVRFSRAAASRLQAYPAQGPCLPASITLAWTRIGTCARTAIAIASEGRESTLISLPFDFGNDIAVEDIVLQLDDLDACDTRIEGAKDILEQVVRERADSFQLPARQR